MMSLKSGLLCESAWALDTLTILLSDDSSLGYFSLSHLPGLVEVLTDHWRRYLVQVFGSEAFDDLEVASDLTKPPSLEKEEPHNVDDLSSDSDASNDSDCEDSVDGFRMPKLLCRKFPRQLDGVKFELPRRSKLRERHNYTLRSRKGLNVVVEENSEEHSIMFDRKAWDSFEGFDSSSMDWQMGHGDMTRHIISSFHRESTETFTRLQFIGPRKRRRSSTDLDRCENNISMDSRVSMVEVDKATCNCNSIDANYDVDSVTVKCDCKTGDEYLEGCSETRKKEAVGDDAFGSIVTEDLNALVLERLKHGWEDESLDPEALQLDPSPMCELSDFKADLADRCACISNIFRSLSFVPGNDIELSKHRGMMMLLGRLLLLHHSHPRRQVSKGRKHSDVLAAAENDDSLSGELEVKFREWWVDVLDRLREDILVILANISGQVKFSNLPHEVCFPILDGLIHWTICPSACAQDPLLPSAATAHLSLQRLAIESLCKLCVTDINVDMILATPPFRRIVQLLAGLVRLLANRTEQVLREFAVSMLSSMTQGNGGVARVVALQRSSLSLLLDFIEGAEQQAMLVANVNGVNTLRESPEMMGTSMDMLRKAAAVLLHVAQVPENQSLFVEQQQRILSLAMSQILDATVTDVLADVLFHCSQLR
jgi:AT-rich interactive domain-containing protein 1